MSSWLHDARAIRREEEAAPSPEELHAIVGDALCFYSLQKVLKNQFDKALHQGARLATGDTDVWRPHDGDLARLHHAWHARAESEITTAALDLRAEWPELTPAQRRARVPSRTVTDARGGRDGSRLSVGRRECLSERPPYPAIDRRAMENCYLDCFIDEDMPLAPGLSVARLAAAWWVIGDAAHRLLTLAKREAALQTSAGWAAAIRRDELVRTLAKALRIPAETADAAVRFLTFGADIRKGVGTRRDRQRGLAAA